MCWFKHESQKRKKKEVVYSLLEFFDEIFVNL